MARGTINTRVKADAKEFKVEMKAVAKAIENISKQLTASNQSFGLRNSRIPIFFWGLGGILLLGILEFLIKFL